MRNAECGMRNRDESPKSEVRSPEFWTPLFALLLLVGCAPKFDETRLHQDIAYLADDALEGRGVGSEGIEQAAQYIAGAFRDAGLQPAGENGSFFQSFEVTLGQDLTGRPELYVAGAPGLGVLYRDYAPLPMSTNDPFAGPVAFVGYGITNDKANYDDYAGFDAKGKVLLMFRYEPRSQEPDAEFGGKQRSHHAYFHTKAQLAKQHGAAAILIVNPLEKDATPDRLFVFKQVERAENYGIPLIHVTRRFANTLLAAAGRDSLQALQESIEGDWRSKAFDLEGITARGNPGVVRQRALTRNVIARLPGAGASADEHVVIGAHYDHLGLTAPRHIHGEPSADAEKEIHNGADDNASGTAVIVEVARLLAKGRSPSRSVLFIAFTAEEMGLLGSDYFVDHPTVPLDKIVAMLNLDMVGRMRNRQVQVHGVKTGAEFESLLKKECWKLGLNLSTSPGGFGPSDHTSFYKKKIPVLHFFTGLHDDYHKPTDDVEKVSLYGTRKISQLVYEVSRDILSAQRPPTYVAVAEKKSPRTGQLKVRMGIMPSYAEDEQPGMTIEGVSPLSPAEKAGLREGDQLLYISEHEVNDVYDLMAAMGHYEPSDEVMLTVVRDGQRHKLPLTFEQP